MQKSDKERVVAQLTERLRGSETLIVADYRGLTMPQIDALRSRLLEHGARFSVVKNTLTRRAAEAAGADALLALLEGPSAVAFVDSDGDPVAVAKALGDAARETRILAVRGGVLQGRVMSAAEVEDLAKLPPAEVLRAQLVGALAGPLATVVGLFNAPLRDLVGVIDARIRQLEEGGAAPAAGADAASDAEPQAQAAEEPAAESEADAASGAERRAQAADTSAAEPEGTSNASNTEPQAETAEGPAAEHEGASGAEPHAPVEEAPGDDGAGAAEGTPDAEGTTEADATTEES